MHFMLNSDLAILSRIFGFHGLLDFLKMEGDGAILSYKGRPLFCRTATKKQNNKEELILQQILSVLGFGTVRKIDKKGTIFYRYIVEDFTGLLLLALIFNGNLAIPNRVKQLDKWLS